MVEDLLGCCPSKIVGFIRMLEMMERSLPPSSTSLQLVLLLFFLCCILQVLGGDGLAVGAIRTSVSSITVKLKKGGHKQTTSTTTTTKWNTRVVHQQIGGDVLVQGEQGIDIDMVPIDISSSEPHRLLLRAIVDLDSLLSGKPPPPNTYSTSTQQQQQQQQRRLSQDTMLRVRTNSLKSGSTDFYGHNKTLLQTTSTTTTTTTTKTTTNQMDIKSSSSLLDNSTIQQQPSSRQLGHSETYMQLISSSIDSDRASSLLHKVRNCANQVLSAGDLTDTTAAAVSSTTALEESSNNLHSLVLGPQKINPTIPFFSSFLNLPFQPISPFFSDVPSHHHLLPLPRSKIKSLGVKELGSPLDSNGNVIYYNDRLLVGWRCPSGTVRLQQKSKPSPANHHHRDDAAKATKALHTFPFFVEPSKMLPLDSTAYLDRKLNHGQENFDSTHSNLSVDSRRRRLLKEAAATSQDASVDSVKTIYQKPYWHPDLERDEESVESSYTTKRRICGIDMVKLRVATTDDDDDDDLSPNGSVSRLGPRNQTSALESLIGQLSLKPYSQDIAFVVPDAPIHLENVQNSYHANPINDPLSRRLDFGMEPNDPLFQLQWALHAENSFFPDTHSKGRVVGSPINTKPGQFNMSRSASATSASGPASPSTLSSGLSSVLDIDVLSAWNLLGPESPLSSYTSAKSPFNATDRETDSVPVAIIDTGINYLHPDLKMSMWINEAELNGIPGKDDDNNGYVDDLYGWNFYHGTNNPMDDNGHGSHVSGIVAAKSNNEIGVSGIAPQAKLMALKILNEKGEGDVSQAIPAINYAIQNKAKIITNSWGGIPSAGGARILETLLREVVEDSADTVFVIAAGNDGINITDSPYYPASFLADNTITVGAYNGEGTVPSWANYGHNNVHLGAPGQNITSTWTGTRYRMSSGTSMAAPMVSGVAALILSVNPYLMPQQIVDIIVQTVTVDPILTPYSITSGRLNAWRSLMLAPAYFFSLRENVLDFEEDFETKNGVAERPRTIVKTIHVRFAAGILPEGKYTGRIEILWLADEKLCKFVVPISLIIEN